jgi:hypothetical protein
MTVEIRPFDSLGRFQNDWLDARVHFGFAHDYDPARTGVGPSRAWNDDRIKPGATDEAGIPLADLP